MGGIDHVSLLSTTPSTVTISSIDSFFRFHLLFGYQFAPSLSGLFAEYNSTTLHVAVLISFQVYTVDGIKGAVCDGFFILMMGWGMYSCLDGRALDVSAQITWGCVRWG